MRYSVQGTDLNIVNVMLLACKFKTYVIEMKFQLYS